MKRTDCDDGSTCLIYSWNEVGKLPKEELLHLVEISIEKWADEKRKRSVFIVPTSKLDQP